MLRLKSISSEHFIVALLVFEAVLLSYAIIYLLWDSHYKYLLKNNGEQVVATIIRKDSGRAQYDIEYEGIYYRRWITLSKKAYRRILVGERFHALILPDKLQHDHEYGITPRCFTIILEPLPICEQRIEEEQIRINNMYNSKIER
jgi:hypothetical protein